jgi:hypothetical protein
MASQSSQSSIFGHRYDSLFDSLICRKISTRTSSQ